MTSSARLSLSFFPNCLPNLSTGLKKVEEEEEEEAPFKKPHATQTSETPAIECEHHHKSISSDESDLISESFEELEDNMEIFRNANRGKPLIAEQDEDEFRTAPNSPYLNEEHPIFSPDLYNAQNRDDIPIPGPAYNSKKRRYIDNMTASEPRKVTRNIAESHLTGYIEVSEVSCHDII